MNEPLISVELQLEHDVVLARQRARQISKLLGFDGLDQTRMATAVSETARNALQYAGGGRVEFSVQDEPPAMLAKVTDRGPGIPNLSAILEGEYKSNTGMGLGIIGSRRLLDVFDIRSSAGKGTEVILGKYFPNRPTEPLKEVLARVSNGLARMRPADALEELQQQNQEVLRALDDLRAQKERLTQVNQELEDTNRGVVALLAELDERTDYLQRASEIKTRFLSNMTHEFRTPLNSILGLARILIDRLDGPLSDEQEKQVTFIQKAADSLSELVNDLLDLAKVEAGKIVVRSDEFAVRDLFGALRGMLRPLLAQNSSVSLVFEEPSADLRLHTDESKISQILRNFISNALKYTEKGEVRVSAARASGNTLVFSVVDTGIGIAPEDQERVFEEFSQIESPLQARHKGTGLGLPLSRKLAGLLGGSIHVKSALGMGSTFHAIVPALYKGPAEASLIPELSLKLDPSRAPVMVVEDNREAMFIYDRYLKRTRYQVVPARTLKQAREWLRSLRPAAIVLDLLLETEMSWNFLLELKAEESTKDIPILVVTMIENEKRALHLGADAFCLKPPDRQWLLAKLDQLTKDVKLEQLLIIDDDEISRYLLRGLLADSRYLIAEASNGMEGVQQAQENKPRGVFLDIVMPGTDGFAVLEQLKADPDTKDIPVVIYTSRVLSDSDLKRLTPAAAIVSKDSPSREAARMAIKNALIAAGLRAGDWKDEHAET